MADETDSAATHLPLGLGTVQFGLDYGATNTAGKVAVKTARAILDVAFAAGVTVLDTASLYGESETVLGELDAARRFDIVTKTVKTSDAADDTAAADAVLAGFERSLRALRTDTVYGLLLHDAADLLGRHGDAIWSTLARLRDEGAAARIGVSVYDGAQIDRVLDRYDPQLVQLPINALDDRLRQGGQLDRLAAAGVEVHARSVFLQGLLLQEPDRLPAKFQSIAPSLAGMADAFTQAGLSIMEGLTGSVLQHAAITKLIVGTTSPDEFRQVECAVRRATQSRRFPDIGRWQIGDERILNPALWSTL